MSDSPARIKLEIEIPTGACPAAAPAPPHRGEGGRLDILFSPRKPPAGYDGWPVKPISGTSLGTICAEVSYDSDPFPTQVKAMVYPLSLYPTSAGPSFPAPGGAVPGYSTDLGRTWRWTDANRVPGADHAVSPTYPANKMAVWKYTGGSWVFGDGVLFSGRTDSSPCASGSGSGGAPNMSPIAAAALYPAVWVVAVAGGGGPTAVFRARWSLHQVPGAERPTWDNGGDRDDVPLVRLSLCPKTGWDLALAFRGLKVSYSLPYSNNPFGPLRFPAREESVSGEGKLALPEVVVAAL